VIKVTHSQSQEKESSKALSCMYWKFWLFFYNCEHCCRTCRRSQMGLCFCFACLKVV